MPLHREITLEGGQLTVWKVTETHFPVALSQASLKRLSGMKREDHRHGFLAIRMLLEKAGLSDRDVFYDANGRPFLEDGRHISISHSPPFAALYTGTQAYGIDIEQVSPKTQKAASYFIRNEVIPAGFELQTHTVIWTVKEAIYKLSHSRPLSFLTDLHVHPFDLAAGFGTATSVFPGWEQEFLFQFMEVEDHILTTCRIRNGG